MMDCALFAGHVHQSLLKLQRFAISRMGRREQSFLSKRRLHSRHSFPVCHFISAILRRSRSPWKPPIRIRLQPACSILRISVIRASSPIWNIGVSHAFGGEFYGCRVGIRSQMLGEVIFWSTRMHFLRLHGNMEVRRWNLPSVHIRLCSIILSKKGR